MTGMLLSASMPSFQPPPRKKVSDGVPWSTAAIQGELLRRATFVLGMFLIIKRLKIPFVR